MLTYAGGECSGSRPPGRVRVGEGGTQFTCFTGTQVQILTQLRQEEAYPRAEPLDWEAEAPENSGMSGTFVLVKQVLFFFRQGSGLGGRGAWKLWHVSTFFTFALVKQVCLLALLVQKYKY
jgi:hypothetical protein